MSITTSQDLGGNTLTTMIVIDFSTCIGFTPTGTTTLRMSANRNGTADIVYDGNTYKYVGFDVSGFRNEINGAPPKPTLIFDKGSLINNSDFTALWDQYSAATGNEFFDARGAKIQIFRTVNLSTTQQTAIQEYVVSQVNKMTKTTIEYELAISLGVDRLGNESVQTLAANRCSLRYRRYNSTTADFDYTDENAGGCPWNNPTTISDWSAVPDKTIRFYNRQDTEILAINKALDQCSYTVKGCQLRFDPNNDGLSLPLNALYSPNINPQKSGS